MQNAVTVVAGGFRQMPDLIVVAVDENQAFTVVRDDMARCVVQNGIRAMAG